jgi:hypothetical protein
MLGVSFCRPSQLCMSNWPLSQSRVLYSYEQSFGEAFESSVFGNIIFKLHDFLYDTYT